MPVSEPIKIDVEDDEDDMPQVSEQPKSKKGASKKVPAKPKRSVKSVKPLKRVVSKPKPIAEKKVSPDIKPVSPVRSDSTPNMADISSTSSSKPVKKQTGVVRSDNIDIALAGGKVKEAVAELTKFDEAKAQDPEEDILQKVNSRHSIKVYKKIAYSFIFVTVILLAAVGYFTFVKVDIVLIPNQERLSNNLIFDIYDAEKNTSIPEAAIAGVVKSVEITNEKSYPSTGSEAIGENVTGKVTLINNYNKNQPLVATTRLLSTDGKLFRLKDTVNVPAGGSIEADVYADQPLKDMSVPPTKFTIPGLWAGLQEQIYAESKEEIKYQQQVKKNVAQVDIDNAITDMKQEIVTKAKADINEQYKDYAQILYKLDEASITSEAKAKAGDEVDEFVVTLKANVVVVAFNEDKPSLLAEQKFTSSLPENKELINFDKENIIYTLNSFDLDTGAANITGTFEGKISLKSDAKIVEVDKIMGLNKSQLDAYLSGLTDIAGYEVKFYPSFIKQVPRLVDRITVEIKK